jgi:hypothetical protein
MCISTGDGATSLERAMEDFQTCNAKLIDIETQLLVETGDIKRNGLFNLQKTLKSQKNVLEKYIRHIEDMELRQLPPPITAGALYKIYVNDSSNLVKSIHPSDRLINTDQFCIILLLV